MLNYDDLSIILETLVLYEDTMAQAAYTALTADSQQRYNNIVSRISKAKSHVECELKKLTPADL